jgi:hypothetical protein
VIIHIVPIGLSIRDGLLSGRGKPPDGTAARRAGTNLKHLGERFHEPDWDKVVTDLLACRPGEASAPTELRELALRRWQPTVSAERHSLAESHARLDGQNADAVVLVATDTRDGLLCAVLNAQVLADGRARYTPNPQLLPRCPAGTVTLVRIPGMDLAHVDAFTDAMRHLGLLGRRLHELHPTAQFRFHLSGGYKAAMPFFMTIAEGMRTLRDDPGSVTACCLHEQTTGDNKLVPVPLRYFPAALRASLDQDLAAVAAGVKPLHHVAEGWAYERTTSGGYSFTSFGEGMRVLLAPTGPALADVAE